jgi:hypothetical protein
MVFYVFTSADGVDMAIRVEELRYNAEVAKSPVLANARVLMVNVRMATRNSGRGWFVVFCRRLPSVNDAAWD